MKLDDLENRRKLFCGGFLDGDFGRKHENCAWYKDKIKWAENIDVWR